MFVVRIRGYAQLAPFVESDNRYARGAKLATQPRSWRHSWKVIRKSFLRQSFPAETQRDVTLMRTMKMDKESKLEEEILASFERGEWQSVTRLKHEMTRYASIASASLAKDKRVNIRISSRDLDDIQAKAAEEAIPYQTLMASILHKYVTGRLVEPQTNPTRHSTRTPQKRGAG